MKNFKPKKLLFAFVLISMFIQVFVVSPFNDVKADAKNDILDELTIINIKDEYAPHESITIEGLWSFPDDTVDKTWEAGESFSISVPDGLRYIGGKINLGNFGVGELVGDKIVFTFNQEIEQKIDRKGGFTLLFAINDLGDEKEKELDLDFKDENNTTILKETIQVIAPEEEGIPESKEVFTKGKYEGQTDEGLRWFIRVDKNGLIESKSVNLSDRVGDDQILDKDSFIITKIEKGKESIDGELYKGNLKIDDDLKGFSIDFDISEHWYDIEYKTIYIGEYGDGGTIMLKNNAYLKEENGKMVPLDNTPGKSEAEGEFGLGGWAQGNKVYGKLILKKIDSVSKEGLKGAKFKFTHQYYANTVHEVETDENGDAEIPDMISGAYTVEEVEAPSGYKKIEDQTVTVTYDKDGKFEYVVENVRESLEIIGEKQWFDSDGETIESQDSIVLELLQDGKVIRKTVLPKGEYNFTFKNLKEFDELGNKIEYKVNEVQMDDYEKTEITNEDGNVLVINKQKPVEPETPKPEEPNKFIEITGEKQWFDFEGKEIKSQDSIEIELLQDGKVIRKTVLAEGEYTFSFENLKEFDEKGNKIEYSINEVKVDGYKKAEIFNPEANTVLIVNQKEEPVKPVEPETPEPEEPVKPVEPETPEPEEPVKPVDPETPEPEEEVGVLSVSKDPDKPVLPQTGVSVNYSAYVVIAAGLALTALSKRKD